jgi:hypothetical protein
MFPVPALIIFEPLIFDPAEKIAVSLCVLVFFWGLFFPMRTVSSQPPCRDFTNLGNMIDGGCAEYMRCPEVNCLTRTISTERMLLRFPLRS